ncbi:MAG: HEPN domain-containing protein [Sedimentisphaerales bacterium]
MKEFVATEWQRALRTLVSARQLLSTGPDSAASRAYYAAFHALTALFALRGQTFSKHTAIRTALHRELIRSGQWAVSWVGHMIFLWICVRQGIMVECFKFHKMMRGCRLKKQRQLSKQ